MRTEDEKWDEEGQNARVGRTEDEEKKKAMNAGQ